LVFQYIKIVNAVIGYAVVVLCVTGRQKGCAAVACALELFAERFSPPSSPKTNVTAIKGQPFAEGRQRLRSVFRIVSRAVV